MVRDGRCASRVATGGAGVRPLRQRELGLGVHWKVAPESLKRMTVVEYWDAVGESFHDWAFHADALVRDVNER